MRRFRCLRLTESAGDKGTQVGSPDKLRSPGAGVGKAEGVCGRTEGGNLAMPSWRQGPPQQLRSVFSLVQTAGEVKMGSLSQQVGSALAAAGGPGMREGRDDSGGRRPLCATPSLYIPGPLRATWGRLQSFTCRSKAGEYLARARALPSLSCGTAKHSDLLCLYLILLDLPRR